MANVWKIQNLPDVDQKMIKRGLCPWCVTRLYPSMQEAEGDFCAECEDRFIGRLTIED